MKQVAQTYSNEFASPPPKCDAGELTAQEFADELFEFEYCAECHGDIKDHAFVIGPFGRWFALCMKGRVE
jgi:hypothetical protein